MKDKIDEKPVEEKGTISVQMENIFPIIKKWLYSEKDIFLRELIANSVDAITKLKSLASLGEFKGLKEGEEYAIEVNVDEKLGTLSVRDNGIGMTAEEVKKYINEVAFSSAADFLQKYKSGEEGSQIIGHFGLGFYSAFMVASLVEIKTRSYQEDAPAVRWTCDGSPEYTLQEIDGIERGTEVILHVTSDEKEFLDPVRVRHTIKTYCDFLPVPIRLRDDVVNKKKPLWAEKAADLKDSDYIEFYHYLYPLEEDPLFWIHLNVEFPVRAKGILYFPKLKHELDPSRGKIKFYYNQVYVSDNLKDLIPEFLMSLQGAIDCPDMPLNVSRSYLQSDQTMKKLSNHITKKVADELTSIHKDQKETYEKYWEEIHPFIKFGMMQNDKFYEQMKDCVIFKVAGNGYVTLSEYQDRVKEKSPDKIYYVSDEIAQSFYVNLFKEQGIDVLVMNSLIDSHFIQFLEFKTHQLKFVRVDSDIAEDLLDKEAASKIIDPRTNKTTNELILEIFKSNLPISGLKISVENLKSEEVPAMITMGEQLRRLREMSVLIQRKPLENLEEHTLVVNASSEIIKNVKKMAEMINPPADLIRTTCEEIYDLALLAQKTITAERLDKFVHNSIKVLLSMTEKIVG
jgi:molecular chaperone HtpG